MYKSQIFFLHELFSFLYTVVLCYQDNWVHLEIPKRNTLLPLINRFYKVGTKVEFITGRPKAIYTLSLAHWIALCVNICRFFFGWCIADYNTDNLPELRFNPLFHNLSFNMLHIYAAIVEV